MKKAQRIFVQNHIQSRVFPFVTTERGGFPVLEKGKEREFPQRKRKPTVFLSLPKRAL